MFEGTVSVRVWGDFACFTRPEMKVERVSYPIMTPSAARGILEAIFWEPQMYYVIDAIRVIKKGRWVSFRRNEVVSQIKVDNAITWMNSPQKFLPVQAGGGAPDGTQRNMLALEEVEYIITAKITLTEIGRRSSQNLKKYLDEIERRAKQGKCFHRPALGVREFAADFEWESDPQHALARRSMEICGLSDWHNTWANEEFGLILYDVFDHHSRDAGFRWHSDEEIGLERRAQTSEDRPQLERKPKNAGQSATRPYEGISVKPQASFFRARVHDGCMDCNPNRVKLIFKPLAEG
jgi:CRISPR-associated protein Cas5d